MSSLTVIVSHLHNCNFCIYKVQHRPAASVVYEITLYCNSSRYQSRSETVTSGLFSRSYKALTFITTLTTKNPALEQQCFSAVCRASCFICLDECGSFIFYILYIFIYYMLVFIFLFILLMLSFIQY